MESNFSFAWLCSGLAFPKDVITTLLELRHTCLGPEDERAPGPKGTALERDEHWESVQGGRCVSFGLQTQHSRSIVNPAAGNKVFGEPDASLKERARIIEVSSLQFRCIDSDNFTVFYHAWREADADVCTGDL